MYKYIVYIMFMFLNGRSNNIDEIINRIINNSLIKREFLLNNREKKSQSIILNKNWQK